jgi:hypothetical protein
LNVGSGVKSLKLGLIPSGFHATHLATHALLHWTNPFRFKDRGWIKGGEIDWDHPMVRQAVEQGHLRIGISPSELNIVAEGFAGGTWASKVPLIGPWSQLMAHLLFEDYIPKLKLATYENAMAGYRGQSGSPIGLFRRKSETGRALESGKLTDAQVSARIGDSVNNAFGELNQAFLGKDGRDPRVQRFLRLVFLAPDFGEARVRFVGKAAHRFGDEERLAFATLALTAYVGARVANQMTHGDPEWGLKNALRVKVGDKFWSFRSVAGDLIHFLTEPRQFMYVRTGPATVQRGWDIVASRDIYTGRKLTLKDQAIRAAETMLPIQLSGLTREDKTFWDSVWQSLGAASERESAEQDMKKLAAEWRQKNGFAPTEEFVPTDEPNYQKLRSLLRAGAMGRAGAMLKALRKTKSDEQIEKAISVYVDHPFTGSAEHEAAFMATLTPEQQRLYYQARQEQLRIRDEFYKLLGSM